MEVQDLYLNIIRESLTLLVVQNSITDLDLGFCWLYIMLPEC